MKIRAEGKDHVVGDKGCSGCQSPEGQEFPQPHGDSVVSCSGLVHAEIFADGPVAAGETVLYRCDVCGESI
ncbi:MAG: hypothetical protein WBV55_17000 [Candidatus Sulfotelmatobacter sp.]